MNMPPFPRLLALVALASLCLPPTWAAEKRPAELEHHLARLKHTVMPSILGTNACPVVATQKALGMLGNVDGNPVKAAIVENDECVNAIELAPDAVISGSTVGALADPVDACLTTLSTAPGIWYKVKGSGAQITLSLCGSGYDTKIGVFRGSCGALVCETGNDDFCGLQSQVSFASVAEVEYLVIVTGFSTASGNFTLAASGNASFGIFADGFEELPVVRQVD